MDTSKSAGKNSIGSVEIYFAKKLANNDKKVRYKALKRLQLWLASKLSSTGIGEEDMMKIWKGLFYCMWYSDKLLVQEELADTMSNVIYVFERKREAGILFSKVFFNTMGREWLGIDRLRLDKFYLFIKNMLSTTLDFIARASWNNQLVEGFVSFIKEYLLSTKYPDGMKLYICEKIIDTIKLYHEKNANHCKLLPAKAFEKLLEPFIECLAFTQSYSLIGVLKEDIFDVLNTFKIKVVSKNGKKKILKVPLNEVANRLIELASYQDVATKNRKLLYKYANRYKTHLVSIKEKKKNPRKRKVAQNSGLAISEDTTNIDKETKTKKKKNGITKKTKSKKRKETQNIENGDSEINVDNNKENGHHIEHDGLLDVSTNNKKENHKFSDDDEDDEVSFPNLHKFKNTKQKLDFDHDNTRIENVEKSHEVKEAVHSNNDLEKSTDIKPEDFEKSPEPSPEINGESNEANRLNNSLKETPSKSAKKKRKSEKFNEIDEPVPIKLIKTTPPPAFFRKAAIKSEQMKQRTKLVVKTPQSVPSKKKVVINLSNNKSICKNDLKIDPARPFSPTRKPSKSAIKTPVSKQRISRPSASDFF